MTHGDFSGSDSKKIIRQQWDRPILEAAVGKLGRPLSYFGLPGPGIQDILDWRDLLGPITGVERMRRTGAGREEDRERHRRLLRNVTIQGIQDFQLLRGLIEDIILDATDIDGNMPKLNNGKQPHNLRFHYDLVNLDFFGGIGYRNKKDGEAKQVRALKKLFERQQGTNFILLITFNVRDGIPDELTHYLEETSARVGSFLRSTVAWYAHCGKGEKEYKLKAAVPLLIQSVAEINMFSGQAFPPVAYDGSGGARMVHFAFALSHNRGNLQAFSHQSVTDLLNLPMVAVEEGTLVVAVKQHPGYDFTKCSSVLEFLPETGITPLLSSLTKPILLVSKHE